MPPNARFPWRSSRTSSVSLRNGLSALVLFIGVGWVALQTSAQSSQKPPAVKAGQGTAEDAGDTARTSRRGWDPAQDFPPSVASDRTVKYDYPIVYVRVPRPYPRAYYQI